MSKTQAIPAFKLEPIYDNDFPFFPMLLTINQSLMDFSQEPDGPFKEVIGDNKKPVFEGTIKNGRLDGKFKAFVGNSIISGTMKQGVLDGICKLQFQGKDRESSETHESTYQDGRLRGPYKIFMGDELSASCNILSLSREWRTSGWDSKEVWTPTYTGELYAKDKFGYTTKELHCAYDDEGKLHGPYERTYRDGNGYTRWVKCCYEHGQRHGNYELRWGGLDGQLLRKCSYEHGKLHGHNEEYDGRTGDIAIRCDYDHGQIVGDYEKYETVETKDAQGKRKSHAELVFSAQYKKDSEHPHNEFGLLHGKFRRYTPGNDEPWLDLSYRDGVLDGECVECGNYYGAQLPSQCSVFKKGKQISYTNFLYDYDREQEKAILHEKREYPGATEFSWDYWHSRDYGIQPELIASCTNLKKLKLDNSSENNAGEWCVSKRKISQEVWDGIARNTDLEDVELIFMDTDFSALSKLKKLKSLTIKQQGMYGNAPFKITDENIQQLGILPELESLSIDTSRLTENGLDMIKQQFPNLKQLNLTTWGCDVSIEQIVRNFGDMKFNVNGLTNAKLEAQIAEMKRQESLIGPGFEDKFKAAIAAGDHRAAAEILTLNGLMKKIDTESEEGEFKKSLNPTSRASTYYHGGRDFLQDVRVIDLHNGNYAVATRREKSHFSSGDGGETMYWYYGDLMVLDLKNGVLAEAPIDYTKTAGFGLGQAIGRGSFDGERATYYALDPQNIIVKDGQISVCDATLPIAPTVKGKGKSSVTQKKTGKSKLSEMLEAASKGKSSPQKGKLPPVNGGNGGNGGMGSM